MAVESLVESMMDFTSGIDGADTIDMESTISLARRKQNSWPVFYLLERYISKPLLDKDNRNVDGIELSTALLPRSYVIVVQRDPIMTVQSLLAAREFVQGWHGACILIVATPVRTRLKEHANRS